jgi:regulatory protein
LLESGLLNDENFAREFATEKYARKKSGTLKIKAELFNKGISKEIVSSVINELDPEEEYNTALIMARKKMREASGRTDDKAKIRQRLFSSLLAKGFDFATARRAVAEVLNNDDF